MSLPNEKLSSGNSRGSPTESEDQTDALRINPFIGARIARDFQVTKTDEVKPNPVQRVVHQKTLMRKSSSIVEECYPTNNEKRGICLIIENDQFSPRLQLSARRGSDVDRFAANKCFTDLGFEVCIHRNLPYQELRQVLFKTAQKDHSKSDCFALVFLSHGNQNIVYAYDIAFATQKLWEPFTADNSPTLGGKPKLFFFQACQGTNMDEGVQVHETETDGGFASYKVPIHSDFLVAHSTVDGFYSWRNTAQGSWYIQTLVKVLQENGHEMDIYSLLTTVAKVVCREYISSSSREEYNDKKQSPFFYSTLTHKLYFDRK